jgi:hypothetical protein
VVEYHAKVSATVRTGSRFVVGSHHRTGLVAVVPVDHNSRARPLHRVRPDRVILRELLPLVVTALHISRRRLR